MRYLGIDYGSKRVGLALSDENGVLAFPFKIILNNKELIDIVHNICGEEGIGSIVIGESEDFSGLPNKIMEEINKFKNKLNSEVGLPIYLEKEFMTTIFARGNDGKKEKNDRKVAYSATSRGGKNKKIDASAAALILQRYLDKKNQK